MHTQHIHEHFGEGCSKLPTRVPIYIYILHFGVNQMQKKIKETFGYNFGSAVEERILCPSISITGLTFHHQFMPQ